LSFLGLDKVTGLSFNEHPTDKQKALIYFNRPHGNYDEIYLTCNTVDQYCSNEGTYLVNSTGNCSDCNFIVLSPIIRGVTYRCQASTIKENFADVISDEFIFITCESYLHHCRVFNYILFSS
jgi:hypothetical protein